MTMLAAANGGGRGCFTLSLEGHVRVRGRVKNYCRKREQLKVVRRNTKGLAALPITLRGGGKLCEKKNKVGVGNRDAMVCVSGKIVGTSCYS